MKKLTRILGGLAIGAAALTTSLAAASPAQAADTEAKLSGWCSAAPGFSCTDGPVGHGGDNAVWISVKSVGVSSWELVDAESGVVAQSGTGNVERTVTGLYSSYTLTVYCGPSYYCSADVE